MTYPQSAVTGALLGSWYAANPGGGTDQIVFTFLGDGSFMVVDKGTMARDPNGTSGLEWGSYSWNPTSGAFSASFPVNTDGQWGLSHAAAFQINVAGDVLTLTGLDGSMTINRLVGTPNSVVGSWYGYRPNNGDLDNVVFTFLADRTFLIGSQGTSPGPDARSGIEWGSYTWDQASGGFSASFPVNTDGEWGLSHAGITRLQVSGDVLTLTSNEGVFSVGRVVNGQAAVVGAQATGTTGADTLTGTAAGDTFTGLGGNDTIDGAAAVDSAVYSAARANYLVTQTATGFTVADNTGAEGTDTLTNIERLRFSDIQLALDLAGNAGTTAKILGAVFGSASVANEAYVGIGLSLLDGGMSYQSLMQLALEARLGANASSTAVVNLLYTNVVGVAPGAADLALYVGLLDSGAMTQASLGVLAADTLLNQTHINLVGLAATGLEFA